MTRATDPQDACQHLGTTELFFHALIAMPGAGNQMVLGQVGGGAATQLTGCGFDWYTKLGSHIIILIDFKQPQRWLY